MRVPAGMGERERKSIVEEGGAIEELRRQWLGYNIQLLFTNNRAVPNF
jgi:hypothetical protein